MSQSGGAGGGPWGGGPWGGGSGLAGQENIPYTVTWDVFDLSGVRQPDDIDRVQTFIEVDSLGDGSQFFTNSFNICSGGSYPDGTGILLIDRAVSENFTVRYDVAFNSLPDDFSNVVEDHIYLGAWSSQDFAAGFFFSKVGVQYTGEVEIDGSGDVVVVQDQTLLPGSEDWIQEGEEYIIRVALNAQTQLLYLFITPKAVIDAGEPPILRALLVAKETQAVISDNVHISARGLNGQVCLEFFNYQMSSKFLVDNLAPVAIAGDDQASRLCGIIQLDGSQSFDPEGEELTYEWRLIDAPQGSMFIVEGSDGVTQPEVPPSGFTNRFYSDTLGLAHEAEPIVAGDVLTMVDGSFTVVETGVGAGSFFIEVEYDQIQDGYTNTAFKLLRQAGLSGPTTVNPTFYPDVLGFWLFDLRVNDGLLSSSPLGTDRSRVLINVVESPLPRACPVDANFMFDYMLSFWKLVEDRDRIGTFFEVISRNSATSVYNLWQLEYSKSLRDIQRIFVHRWLHYDLLLPEPLPEITSLKYLWSGVRSDAVPQNIMNIPNSVLVVNSPRMLEPLEITLSSPSPATPERYASELETRLREAFNDDSFVASVSYSRASIAGTTPLTSVLFPTDVAGLDLVVSVDGAPADTVVVGVPVTLSEFVAELVAGLPSCSVTLEGQLVRLGSRSSSPASRVDISSLSTLLTSNGGPLDFAALTGTSDGYIRVVGNQPITFTSLSTAPGFSYPAVNTLIGGTGGQRVAERTFRASYTLDGLGLEEDDLLVIEREAYRVVQVVNDPSDPFPFQRVVVKDEFPEALTPSGVDPAPTVGWAIPGWVQSELLNFYDGMVDRGDYVDFEAVIEVDGTQLSDLVETHAIGANAGKPNRLGVDTAVLAGVTTGREIAIRLARVIRRHRLPIDLATDDIPILSEVIDVEDPDSVLRRNVDFFIEEYRGANSIRFSAGVGTELGDVWEGERPPPRLWAEYTFIDNEALIEANFGVAIGLTRDKVPDNVDYLSAVRGIWYALYNGPTLANLRIAMQIFLGLPFAEVAGTITEIRTDFFSQRSRILIQDADNPAIVRSYVYPRVLDIEVNPDTGARYVVGDTVTEFAPLVTGAEVTDWVKDPTWFAGIVNQGIFSEVQKYHTFLVRVEYEAFTLNSLLFAQQFIRGVKPVYTDPLYVILFRVSGDGDEIDVIDSIEYKVKLHLQDSICDRFGAGYTFDQPWPGGAAFGENWRNDFDEDDDPGTPEPTYPGPSDTVYWGYDKMWLCPEDTVTLERCEDLVNEVPSYDSIWKFDQGATEQVLNSEAGPQTFPYDFALGAAPSTTTLTKWFLQLNGPTAGITEGDWVIEILVNAVVQASAPLTLGAIQWQNPGPTQVLVLSILQNVDVMGDISVPVTVGDALAIRVRPVSGSPQNPGWTSFNIGLSYQGPIWTFDSPPLTGTFCAEEVVG